MSARGVTLAIVLWAMVALGALALAAATAARIETILQGRYRDHAAALAIAEAGLAEARAALALDPGRVVDTLRAGVGRGRYQAGWVAAPQGVRIVSEGRAGDAVRTIEARITLEGGLPRVTAWREVW